MHIGLWLFSALVSLIYFSYSLAMKNAAGQAKNQINLPIEHVDHEDDIENHRQVYQAKLINSSDIIVVYKYTAGPKEGDKEGTFYSGNPKDNGSIEYSPISLYPELAENCFFVLSSAFKEQAKKLTN